VGKAKEPAGAECAATSTTTGLAAFETGTLIGRGWRAIDFIQVDNEKGSAGALEQPDQAVEAALPTSCCADDKTYPYIKARPTKRFRRVYVTAQAAQGWIDYYGPYCSGETCAPAGCHFIHRHFKIPSCNGGI